jgi:hypothetical protein
LLSGSSTAMPLVKSRKDKGLSALLRELSDDKEDTTMDTQSDVPDDPQQPWIRDYCAYMDVPEQVPEGWTAIQWWGVSTYLGFNIVMRN